MSRWIGAIFLAIMLVGCSVTPRTFPPINPIAPDRVSHRAWDQIVQAHVRDGQVDYPAIQAGSVLDGYLGELNRIDPAKLPTRQHQLSFWINAYNAFAVKGILEHYSPMTLWGAIAISSVGTIRSVAPPSTSTILSGKYSSSSSVSR